MNRIFCYFKYVKQFHTAAVLFLPSAHYEHRYTKFRQMNELKLFSLYYKLKLVNRIKRSELFYSENEKQEVAKKYYFRFQKIQ